MKRHWRRGYTLPTETTNKWSDDMLNFNNKLELSRVYTNFTAEDDGKSRSLVCVLNEAHPEYEKNAQLITGAPLMFDTIVITAARDGFPYLFDLIEQVTGERWTQSKMNEEAVEARKRLGITF